MLMYVSILFYTDFTVYHGDPRGSLKGRDLTENSFVANHANVRCSRIGPVDHTYNLTSCSVWLMCTFCSEMYVSISFYTDFTVYHGDPRGSLKGLCVLSLFLAVLIWNEHTFQKGHSVLICAFRFYFTLTLQSIMGTLEAHSRAVTSPKTASLQTTPTSGVLA